MLVISVMERQAKKPNILVLELSISDFTPLIRFGDISVVTYSTSSLLQVSSCMMSNIGYCHSVSYKRMVVGVPESTKEIEIGFVATDFGLRQLMLT
jgi:hypothetical protein